MDPSSPLSLASIPILLIPIGPVRQSTWSKWSSLVCSLSSLSQSDIPLDGNLRRSRFFPSLTPSVHACSSSSSSAASIPSPKSNSSNQLHLSYSHSIPPPSTPSSTSLSLFRPSTQILAVVGIVDLGEGGTTGGLAMARRLMAAKVEELFPMGGGGEGYPLVSRCFGVEQADDEGEGGGREVEIDGGESSNGAQKGDSVVVIPSQLADPKLFVGALLGEMLGALLAELADVATILESPSGLALLQQSTLPPFSILPRTSPPTPTSSSRPSLTNYNNHVSLPSLPIQNSSSSSTSPVPRSFSPHRSETLPTNAPSSLGSGPPPSFSRSNSTLSVSSSRTGSPGLSDTGGTPVKTGFGGPGRKRIVSAAPSMSSSASTSSLTLNGSSSSHTPSGVGAARLATLIGSLHLICGRLGDAVLS
ncbi:hypothetical protein BDY24DRAFT_226706 [Mrakia frigida]|uniref:uncharacterized protein n=1 Tax=Mrakia frigida TaxID=29902 RepID=UPI003FCC1153